MLAGTAGMANGIAGMGYGLGSGLADLARTAEKRQEELKRETAIGKSSKALLKAIGADAGLHPMEIENLSSADAAAAASALIGAQQFKRGKQEGELSARRLAAMAAEEQNTSREGAFMSDVARYQHPGDMPQGLPLDQFEAYALPEGQGQPGFREVAASAARTGYRPNLAQMDDVLRAAATAGRGNPDDAPGEFLEDPETGQRFFVKRNQVLPSGTNPQRKREPEPQYDEEGTLLGHTIFTGGRAGIFQRARLPDTLTRLQRLNALQRQHAALVQLPSAENQAEAAAVQKQIQQLMAAPPESRRSDARASKPTQPPTAQPPTGSIETDEAGARYEFLGGDPTAQTSWKRVK